MILINGSSFFCPLCYQQMKKEDPNVEEEFIMEYCQFDISSYLYAIFKEDYKLLWLANMITHYRHVHVNWYNRANSNHYYLKHYDHDSAKIEQNERAKRQIIRKCSKLLIEHFITSEDFKKLQHSKKQTIELAEKFLDNRLKNKVLEVRDGN